MTRDEIQSAALALPAAERRELVEVLWQSLEQDPEPTLEGQRQLLDDRLEALEVEPEAGDDWQEAEKRVWDECAEPAESSASGLDELVRRGLARAGGRNRPDLYPSMPSALPGSDARRLLDLERGLRAADGLTGCRQRHRDIPWVGVVDDPTAPPARDLEDVLPREWPDDIDRDRR